jgi:hypothetical protein
MPWMAHVDYKWYNSTDDDVPESKPTNKQRTYFRKTKHH